MAEEIFAHAPAHWGAQFTKTIHQKPSDSIDPSKVTLPDGYVVVVTGAGKGIGEYIAKAYAEAKASDIIITSRTASDLDRVKGALENIAEKSGRNIRVATLAGDAKDVQSYVQIKDLVEKDFGGRIDCLVCNAGGGKMNNSWGAQIHTTATDEFDDMTALNHRGAYYAAKHLIPLLLNPQSKGKTLINISSGAAHMTSITPHAYCTAKLALNRLSQHIGESYTEEGLTCVALHPGTVLTPGAEGLPEEFKASEYPFPAVISILLNVLRCFP